MYPCSGGNQDISLSGFDFLYSADVEIDRFSESLLSKTALHSLPPKIRAEFLEEHPLLSRRCHAPLWRKKDFDATP